MRAARDAGHGNSGVSGPHADPRIAICHSAVICDLQALREADGGTRTPDPIITSQPIAPHARLPVRTPAHESPAPAKKPVGRTQARVRPGCQAEGPRKDPFPLVTARVEPPMLSAPWPAMCAWACTRRKRVASTERLLAAAHRSGAKVMAIGDFGQLASVGSGGWMRAVGERVGCASPYGGHAPARRREASRAGAAARRAARPVPALGAGARPRRRAYRRR
jgi:hypothetical protein